MTRILFLTVVLALVGAMVHAQTVTVRSGEHATFSRLTLTLPDASDWSITQAEETAILRLRNSDVRFDTTGVFARIPRTRLTGLSRPTSGNGLVLRIGCDCDLDWFVDKNRLLVIDIKDKDPDERDASVSLPWSFGLPLGPRADERLSGFRLSNPVPAPLGVEIMEEPSRETASEPDMPTVVLAGEGVGLNISETRLLEQIGRAANQGLLTPVSPRSRVPPDPSELSSETPAPQESRQAQQVNVIAATSVDLGLSDVSDALLRRAERRECLDPGMVALHDWTDGRPMVEQISHRRARLFGEFDQLNEEAVRTLAETYLYFGLGAEARMVLKLSRSSSIDGEVLQTIAKIMDNEDVPAENPFTGQDGCDGGVALLSILAGADPSPNVDTDNVQKAFSRLPAHLRILLGPRLSEAFTRVGNTTIAASVLRAIDRTDESEEPAKKLAEALVEKSAGDVPEAIEQLEDVVDTNSEHAPRALAELIETSWFERRAVTPDVTELAAAYATELGDGTHGGIARRALAISLVLSGRHEDAIEVMDKISERDGRDALASVAIPVITLSAENADDITFLQIAFDNLDLVRDTESAEMQEATTRRLLDLGFPQVVLTLLDGTGGSASKEQILLRAEAAIGSGLPHRALVELLSATGPEADALRARAMLQSGNLQLAGEAFLDAGRVEEGARSFWLSDVFDEVPASEGSRYADVVKVSGQLDRDAPDIEEMAPLAGARTLLAESEELRRQADELMDLVVPQGDGL